nr:MAG TPA_asm: hypothetical protein [Bacteriophage sp.]
MCHTPCYNQILFNLACGMFLLDTLCISMVHCQV